MATKTVLDFEKSIADLDENLTKLRQIVTDRTHPDNTPKLHSEIADLEAHRVTILRELFRNLTPWDEVLLARHERRPYTLDYVHEIVADFQELRGDRFFADDGAIVAGIGRIDGIALAIVGHQKGRDIKQRQYRNFGYARPEGYRKAVRVMKLAAKFGMPVLTLIDTPGAAADVSADERGISEAIARSMAEMSQLPVPIVSVVIGEGGSGGALGLAVANRVLMLEHSFYSVITPEGCASILWRDSERKAQAAEALKLTASNALDFGIVDEIIPEPLGGAHRDWSSAAQNLRDSVVRNLRDLIAKAQAGEDLVDQRYRRFRKLGHYLESPAAPPKNGHVAVSR